MASLQYLDPNAAFTLQSVQILDSLVSAMSSSQPNERDFAVKTLKEIKETHNLWIHVDTIIENAKIPDTKFFALSILDHVIETA